jgi:hypothetical protein
MRMPMSSRLPLQEVQATVRGHYLLLRDRSCYRHLYLSYSTTSAILASTLFTVSASYRSSGDLPPLSTCSSWILNSFLVMHTRSLILRVVHLCWSSPSPKVFRMLPLGLLHLMRKRLVGRPLIALLPLYISSTRKATSLWASGILRPRAISAGAPGSDLASLCSLAWIAEKRESCVLPDPLDST